MEQWQFLIQKQGERAWQPLESLYAEIVEGRYRIVASSLRANTEVEVRVIHQSPSEIPPRRRIHKRLRRTNSEGLTAVIPFTYFTPGVWEVRCSGDLMSDILGTSWQYNLRLQVLPLVAATEITPAKNDGSSQEASMLPIPPAPPNFAEAGYSQLQLDDIALSELTEQTIIEVEITKSSSVATSESNQDIPQLNEPIIDQASEETDEAQFEAVNQVTAEETTEVDHEEIIASDHTVVNSSSINYAFDDDQIELESSTHSSQGVYSTAPTSDENLGGENTTTENTHTIIDEPISLSTNNLALQVRPNFVEAIVDQPVNPVWIRGNNAEQILQNLIELALPGADPLLEEETVSQQLEQPLPLLLILDEQSYVTQWGRACTIHGRVKLRDIPPDKGATYKDDTSEFESVGSGELQVQLCSPLGLEVLVQKQQCLGERLLPFGFEFSIDIPASCESKLILGDIYLYGALSSLGEPILLASQCFTITADVGELLAANATAKPSEPDMLDVIQPQLTPEPEKSISLNLELFNLARTARQTPVPLAYQPSPKRTLPLQVDERRQLRQTPQFSNLESYTTELTSVISNSTSLPFLRRRQVAFAEETASNILVESQNLELENHELENLGLDVESKQYEHVNTDSTNFNYIDADNIEIVKSTVDHQIDNYTQPNNEPARKVTLPIDTRIGINNQPYVSPLIQKWMQSQGYSVSDNTNNNLEYSNYYTNTAPQSVPIINIVDSVNSSVDYSVFNSIENSANENISDESNNSQGAETLSITPESELSVDTASVASSSATDIQTSSTHSLAAEIVIDDVDENISISDSTSDEVATPEETVATMLSSLPFSLEDIEVIPVPQVNLPPRELVSGSTIRVRILLQEVRPNTGIKLWVEDCQTRWLLEGPHLLTDLLPNTFASGMECVTELSIPFGCVEIRIEAISVDLTTQLESDKASVRRTVVPPDLPILQFDELLGI